MQSNRDPDTALTENGTQKIRSGRVSKLTERLEAELDLEGDVVYY